MSDQNYISDVDVPALTGGITQVKKDIASHLGKHYSSVHGDVVVSTVDLFNIDGNRVGRRGATILVGGKYYQIACDQNVSGPPQVPRITSQPVTQSSNAGPGQGQPDVAFSAACTGTLPIKFQWEYSFTDTPFTADDSAWSIIPNGFGPGSSGITSLLAPYSASANNSLQPPTGTGTSTTLRLSVGSTDETGPVVIMYIRCKFYNGDDPTLKVVTGTFGLNGAYTPTALFASNSTDGFLGIF